jgi:AraC-like DNA-binding protein
MSAKNGVQGPATAPGGGLFRAALAGPGRSLADAFENLDRGSEIQHVTRHPTRRLFGARIALKPEEGQGHWEFTQIGEDLYVIAGNFVYKDPRIELVPGDGLVQFYFKLCGDLTLGVSRTEPLRLNKPTLLLYNQPPGIEVQEWTAPSARERFVALTMKARYLVDNFLGSVVAAPPQLASLLSGSPREISYSQLPLSAQMFEIATRLVDNPHTGVLGLVYTEALVLELLCAALSEYSALPATPTEAYSERDLLRLQAARTVLMKQFTPAPRIREVARAAGMNETSLKRGFRVVYGETVFDFSLRCRMQHAFNLLRERRMPIAQVAEAVGYSHQTSFATAFRRYFGVSPKDARPAKMT